MTKEQTVVSLAWATNEITALRAKVASLEAAQSASNSPTTNGEVSEPPLKSEGLYYASGGHAPASGSRDGSEILAPAMEAARIPAAPDVERVARALYEAQFERGTTWDDWEAYLLRSDANGFDGRDECRRLARVALSALPIPATGEVGRQKAVELIRLVLDEMREDDDVDTDSWQLMLVDARAALTDHTTKAERALVRCSTAMNAFIYKIGLDDAGNYYWTDPPLRAEAQEALAANNEAFAALTDHTTKDALTEQGEKS